MNTDAWGSHEWESMQFKAFGSPEEFTQEDKKIYKDFFEINAKVLPCSLCRKSVPIFYKYLPIDEYLKGRYSLCYYVFILHNLVNRKLGKPTGILSDYIYKYENMRARCGNKNDIEKYNSCKASLQEYSYDDAINKALELSLLYEEKTKKYLKLYYESSEVLDHEFTK